jgi:serine/threonine protein kinase/predicted Zn-dependent protease/predicted CopG family antitoxin
LTLKCHKCQTDNPDTLKFCGECGTQLILTEEISAPTETLEAAREELTRGTTFANRYEIIEELGKGGMGKVYRVEDKKIKEEVALKLIKPEIASDKKTLERFSNELKMARKIAHRNVCRMYDLGEEKGTHYITMEYVPGEDLKRLIRKVGQFGAGKTVSIAKQVCEGLAEAHRLGVVHRDLKPQNIMVDEEGNARIMDFGIARSLKAKGITGAGVMIGTPEYMSPEQAEVKEVDQRSDIYSLGVILYEMVTGRVPFEGETPLGIAMKHKSEMPKDPKELNAQIPDGLNNVILRCLEKDKEQRYQSAGEVRSELANIEKGIPTTEKIVPERKPITSREITVTVGLKKLLIPALVIAALVIAAVIVWQLLPQKEVVTIPTGKPLLAIMYFKNNTGDDNLDVWRSALSEMLISDLSQSKHLRILPDDRLFGILNKLNLLKAESYSTKDLKEVAAQGGATHVLRGILTRSGDSYRINTTLQESSTMEIIGSDMVEGRGETSFHTMVDELTRKVKENFRLSTEEISSDLDEEVGKITTSSPEAFKYYSEGRKYHLSREENRESIQLMERAIALDPGFAMAYRSMAMSYFNLRYFSKWKEYIQKAMELSDRLSDRERYQIEGDFYAGSQKTYDKAIDAYNQLLELYPGDVIGNSNLGLVYIFLEQWDKAIYRYEFLRKQKDDSAITYGNLATAYMGKGLNDKARETLEYYLDNFADRYMIRRSLAYNYLLQGKYDLALVEADKAFSLDPVHHYNFCIKGDIFHYKGDLTGAEKEYQNLLEAENPISHIFGRTRLGGLYLLQGKFKKSKNQTEQGIEKAKKLGEKQTESLFHNLLAYNHLKSGNPEEAIAECDEAWSAADEAGSVIQQRVALHYKGLAYLEMKSFDKAQRVAAELKDMIESGLNRKGIRYYHHLMGMIELEKENFSEAIKYFKKAISLLPYQYLFGVFANDHAGFYAPLASAYYKAEDLENARQEYERILLLTTGRLYQGDIYAKSFYMLGKIHEEQGDTAKAIEHYEKFLDLWKNADPGIPEIEDAKKRLAGLKKIKSPHLNNL